jgi:hypothetical protein
MLLSFFIILLTSEFASAAPAPGFERFRKSNVFFLMARSFHDQKLPIGQIGSFDTSMKRQDLLNKLLVKNNTLNIEDLEIDVDVIVGCSIF